MIPRKNLRFFGHDIRATTMIFIAQIVAFWLMVIGFTVFLFLWYKGNI